MAANPTTSGETRFYFDRLQRQHRQLGERLHDSSAWVISGVILLHLTAVAFHQWVKPDEVLSRMTGGWFGRPTP